MEQVATFISELVDEMEGTSWQIESVVEYSIVTEEGKKYARVDESLYKEQEDYFLEQWTAFEDSYYGTIIYPITDKKALKISYNC